MSSRARRNLAWILTGMLVVFIFVQGYLFNQVRNERIAAEEEKDAQLHRVRLLLYAAPDPMIMCNGSRHITAVNLAAANLLGWHVNELVGKPVKVLVRDGEQYGKHSVGFERSVTQLREGEGDTIYHREGIEGTAITRTGDPVPVVLSVSGIYHDDRVEFVATIRVKASSPITGEGMRKVPNVESIREWLPTQSNRQQQSRRQDR